MNIPKTLPLLLVIFFLVVLMYTRFVGLGWGLPYPFHPDERNMAYAIEQLHCTGPSWTDCLNPNFFAYGQFPLYLSYGAIMLAHLITSRFHDPITFNESTLALRFFSALAAVGTFFVSLKIIELIEGKKISRTLLIMIASPLLIFSPALIQFAHFGTTESLLMFCYTVLIWLSLAFVEKRLSFGRFIPITSFLLGVAIGTKISSVIFLSVPFFAIVFYLLKNEKRVLLFESIFRLIQLLTMTACISLALSPHTFIHWSDFISSMRYETGVAQGTLQVFYTRQFFDSLPVWFQTVAIFPYALGWPVFILCIVGMFGLRKDYRISFLRLSFFLYFLPTAFLFTKWTRFMSPLFPLMVIFACLIFLKIYEKRTTLLLIILMLVAIIPGVAFLSIYNHEDVRITASRWILSHVPADTSILSETANVVDIPLEPPGISSMPSYSALSFDFYSVDENPDLQKQLANSIQTSDFIFVPSRRVFADHTCYSSDLGYRYDRCSKLLEMYPILNQYYKNLFGGTLGFNKVAEFTSYPRIELFGKTLISFPDEGAEETWSVFDHPVVRIYQKVLTH